MMASEVRPIHALTAGPVPTAWLGALLLGAALCACDKPVESHPLVPVKVQVLEPEPVVVSTHFSGSIEPLQTTDLAFKLAGTVASLHRPAGTDRDVQVGDVLAKGTVIAELDEGDLRRAKASAEAKVAQLEARVATARDTLEIASRILDRFEASAGSVSQVARDDAAAKRVAAAGELATAEQALADARVQLDQATDDYANRQLVVPFDNATVALKRIETGERKAAHEVAFSLIDISTVHVTFGVPDTMIGDPAFGWSAEERIQLGQVLQITADAFEGRTLAGAVTKIAPEADARTRTFLIELTLDNPRLPDGQHLLRPGMIVTVKVGSEADRRLVLLPMDAVHRGPSPDELIAWEVVDEGGQQVARERRVALGGVYDSRVELLPDRCELKEGARVVLTTAERLSDGALVQVLPNAELSPAVLPEAR